MKNMHLELESNVVAESMLSPELTVKSSTITFTQRTMKKSVW